MKNFGFAYFMSEYWAPMTGEQVRLAYEQVASQYGETLTSLTLDRDGMSEEWETEYYMVGLVSQDAFAGIVAGVRALGIRVKEAQFDVPKHSTESLDAHFAWTLQDYETRSAIWARQDAELERA